MNFSSQLATEPFTSFYTSNNEITFSFRNSLISCSETKVCRQHVHDLVHDMESNSIYICLKLKLKYVEHSVKRKFSPKKRKHVLAYNQGWWVSAEYRAAECWVLTHRRMHDKKLKFFNIVIIHAPQFNNVPKWTKHSIILWTPFKPVHVPSYAYL